MLQQGSSYFTICVVMIANNCFTYQDGRPWLLMIIPFVYGYGSMMISPFASANSEAHLFLIDPLIFDDDRYEVSTIKTLTAHFELTRIFILKTTFTLFSTRATSCLRITSLCQRCRHSSTSLWAAGCLREDEQWVTDLIFLDPKKEDFLPFSIKNVNKIYQ